MKKSHMFLIILSIVISLSMTSCNSRSNNSLDRKTNEYDKNYFIQYKGSWGIEDTIWELCGDVFCVDVDDQNLIFSLESSDEQYVSVINGNIPFADITSNEIFYDFEDDGWGKSGTLKIVFRPSLSDKNKEEKSIFCLTTYTNGYGSSGTYVKYSDDMTSISDYVDFELYYPKDQASNASDIFCNWKVTEQEFREMCYPIQYEAEIYGYEVIGYDIDILEGMLNYPNDYYNSSYFIDNCYVSDKFISDDGYPCYVFDMKHLTNYKTGKEEKSLSEVLIRMYDFRDDVQSPNISVENRINCYAIFRGIQTDGWGRDNLVFWLLSCDKR